jgi:uncharacterized protein (TIGR03435 family)
VLRQVLLAAIGVAVSGQAQTFEVASVKAVKEIAPRYSGPLAPPPPPPPSFRDSPAGLTILHATLMDCLTWAHGVRRWQVSGPDWISTERYDISARTAAPAPVDQLKLMLQALLADRFRMTLHREKRDAPVMALVTGKDGPRFHAASPGTKFSQDVGFSAAGIRSTYRNASLDVLEGMLSGPGWDPVLNMTGLTGGFDFVYERPNRDPENGDAWFGDLQASIQKQLGLKLERRKAPMEFIVIDRAEKAPIEN